MNNIIIEERVWDRNYSTEAVTLNGKNLLCPNISPLLKTMRPDEVDLLYRTKGMYALDHVQSFVVRIFDAPQIYFPKIDNRNHVLEHFFERPQQNPFDIFLENVVSIPDVGFEFLYYDKNRTKIYKFASQHKDLSPIVEYLDLLNKHKAGSNTPQQFARINKTLHEHFWQKLFEKSAAKKREAIIGRILDYERKYFDYDNPPTNLIDSLESFEYAKRINATSQAIAYSNERECATSFQFHSATLSDEEIVSKLVEYLKTDKTKLTILKFKNLDLRAHVNYTMRSNFKKILTTISDIKIDNKNKAYMLLEAGNQYAVCLPVFEIVSRAFSMIDSDVTFGRNNGRGQFWDSTANYPRSGKEMEHVFDNDPELFRQTNEVANKIGDLKTLDKHTYNKIRRQYFLASLNQQATNMKKHIENGTSEVYLNQMLRNSELSPLSELILN